MGRWILAAVVLAVLGAGVWFLLHGFPVLVRPISPIVDRPAAEAPPAPVPVSPIVPAPAPPPAAPEPAPAPAVVDGLALTGRVVDDRRFPMAGARVLLHRTGAEDRPVVAGADGRFRFEGIPRPASWVQGGLVARTTDGRIAVGATYLGPKSTAEVDAGVLIAGEAVPLAVRVVDEGAPVPGAKVHAGWTYDWPLAATAGPDGVARFEAVPKLNVNLLASAADPARAGRASFVAGGGAPQPVELTLAPARTVEVTVVEKGTEAPIPGATLRVLVQWRSPGMVMQADPGPLPPIVPTDAAGRTRIEGTCVGDTLTLDEVKAPGFFPAGFGRGFSVKAGETSVRVELVGGRPLRFPVVAGESPVPPDGAVIRLLPMPGSGGADPTGEGRMEGTDLVVPVATRAYFAALAMAPDGSRARLWADDKESPPKEVSFRPGRTVEIAARRTDGTPAAGAAFVLRDQGNNPLGDAAVAGPDGRAVFEGLYGDLTQVVHVDDPSQPYNGRVVGTVDLAKSGGSLEVVVPSKRAFVASVTVDGTPRLPARLFIQLPSATVSRFDEDPEKGILRFEAVVDPAATSITANLAALPFLPASATASPVPETGPIPLAFDLRTGGVLLLEVKPPKDTAYRLNLQRWDETKGVWTAANILGGMMGPALAPGPDGIARAEPLVAGRYRVVESMTGVSTEGVEVRPGGEAARLALDISRQGYAKGKVAVPEGAAMGEVRILVRWAGQEARPPTGAMDDPAPRTQPDGSFWVRVPGDRPVTVIPWHPFLVPAPENGTAEVTEPREDLVLRLVAGARASLRLDPAPVPGRGSWARPRVLLYAGEPVGDPVSEHPVVPDGSGLAFGGFKAGTWTLWIDPSTAHAPVIVRGAVLAETGTDLGTIALTEGSRIRVKILVKEGTAAPRIGLFASREDAPKYTRGMNSNGEETAVLAGLGPGRFRISAMPVMGSAGKGMINEVRDIDGTNDLELTLDLR